MFEFLDETPDINVQESEYKRLLGYPANHVVNNKVKELMDTTRQWYSENGKPWIYSRQSESFELRNNCFVINEKEFTSKRVFHQMSEAEGGSVVAAAVSAGKNCEERARQLWLEEKPDEYFFMEVYGSAIVEHLIANAAGRICTWANRNAMAALPQYSPGYPEWEITEQQKLYDVIAQNNNYTFPEEIQILHTGMLNPKKSLLTIFGLTRHPEKVQRAPMLIPCVHCSLANCQYRRAAFKHSNTEVVDSFRSRSMMKGDSGVPLNVNAKYTFNPKALEKWSKERLRLKFNDDHSIDAFFRYQGSTCSNMGHILEFEYHVKLGSAETDFKIMDAACMPAQEDSGVMFMCRYIENPESIMKDIGNEKPLVGMPLNDILTWEREYNPAACYCSSESRKYKWGLVLEVVHYALGRYQMENVISN